MKTKIKFFAVLFIGLAVALTSCNKQDENTPATDSNTNYSKDNSLAESVYDNVTNITNEAYDYASNGYKKSTEGWLFLGDCATVTLDTTVMPRVLTIDFGEENCLCNDLKYRRGKIIVTFTGGYRHPGTVITTNFEDYYVNDNNVDGTKVVTNMGLNDQGNLYYNISVTGVIHLSLDRGTLSWNSTRVREWIEGVDTRKLRDDVYLITGSATGIRPNGHTWETEIINALRVELSCKYIVSGTVEIRPEGLSTRVLDYGDGECDNIATVVIDGVTYTIFLH
ncbi:MAG: hypothetical protein GXO86_02825 [Chlorobi bacterium]|nr:hypothetical protein [Chlorobiota bacterium]